MNDNFLPGSVAKLFGSIVGIPIDLRFHDTHRVLWVVSH